MVDRLNPTPLEAAKNVYNSYLLLHKLSGLKVNNGRSLNDVISEATLQNKKTVSVTIHGEQDPYLVRIEKQSDNSYKLKLLSNHTKPEVKDVLSYTAEEIIGLWANTEVSIEKDALNNVAFAVGLQNLKVGGLGKKVPFSLRFANFYKVIEILQNEEIPLKEKFRLANNIATGSGKTGDIALLKLWAYLTDTPCITIVPDHLIIQSNKFDKEFLPDEVVRIFREPFSETNTRFATTTFTEALDKQWNLFKSTYGESSNKEPALTLIDEAPKLKENAVLLARAIKLARNNPIAFFSATPDAFLSEEFKIPEQNQILLSPKERTALGIAKLPIFYVANGIYSSSHRVNNLEGSVAVEAQYVQEYENVHTNLDDSKKNNQSLTKSINAAKGNQEKSQLFLRFIDETLDSKAYKVALIASEKQYHNRDDYIKNIVAAITSDQKFKHSKSRERVLERKESFFTSIKNLNTGLSNEEIRSLIEENLDTRVGGELLASAKLYNIIDTFNEYKKSGKAFNKNEISKFIKDKYSITNTSGTNFNSELTDIILELGDIYKNNAQLRENFDRNYGGDKKLHDNIFSKSDAIKKFCEKDVVISYFDGAFRRFNAERIETEENLSKSDKDNVLNFVRAGFVPKIISKELAIGIDAPRIDHDVLLAPELSEILSPNFVLQFTGRVGRDVNRKGKCYVDFYIAEQEYINLGCKKELSKIIENNLVHEKMLPLYPYSIPEEYREFPIVPVEFTNRTVGGIGCYRYIDKKYMHYATPMYLNPENISKLSGKDFFDTIERGNEKYYNDEVNIYSIYASLMNENICSTLRQFQDAFVHNATFSKKGVYNEAFQSIKDALKAININFNYDKEKALKVFYYALLQQKFSAPTPVTHSDVTEERCDHPFLPQSIVSLVTKTLKSAMKNEMAVTGSNAIPKYSDNMSLEDWVRYIVHTKPMSFENLVETNPNSNAPVFMEQKERSKRKNVSVHNASAKLSSTTGSPVPAKASGAKTSTGIQQNVGPSITAPSKTTPVTTQVPVSVASTGGQRLVSSNFAAQSQPIQQTSESSTTGPTAPLENPFTTGPTAPLENPSTTGPTVPLEDPSTTGPTVSLEDPSTKSESPQRTSTKKKVVYGFMIASPLLAVGIYTAIIFLGSTGLAFNPAIAVGIFVGVALAAIALFGIIKLYEKVSIEKQENPGMGTWPALKEVLTPERVSSKAQGCADAC